MKKYLLFFVPLFVISFGGVLFSQDHVVISEILVTPTDGEFIEIYNPTSSTVDLSNYYITDATFADDTVFYYLIVTGDGGGGDFWDFNARFPEGAQIAPSEFQTIAIPGDSTFFDEYGVLPTYELFEDSTAFANDVPNMREAAEGSIASPFNSSRASGLTNSGEVVILYYWDGVSDLVKDVDYAVWGDKEEAVDKTGVRIDSNTDADTDSSDYQPDTPIASQSVIATGAHAFGMSWQRSDPNLEVGETTTGGNGITGQDETSEDLGAAFTQAEPTPGNPTSVELISDQIPRAFELEQNYPNPFNPETSIRYALLTNARVKLDIYNPLGQKIATLVDENQVAGNYLAKWNGRNDSGQLVSSGVYVYRLEAGDFLESKKMLLLK